MTGTVRKCQQTRILSSDKAPTIPYTVLESFLLILYAQLSEDEKTAFNYGRITMRYRLAFLVSLLASLARSQRHLQLGTTEFTARQNISNMPAGETAKDNDAAMSAMHSMEGTMNMGLHMRMTGYRPVQHGSRK